MLGLAIWFLPWYTLGFGLLAFLPRWRWLLSGGAAALAFCIVQLREIVQNDGEFAEIGGIVSVFLATGFASGFLGRGIVLVSAARNWKPAGLLPSCHVYLLRVQRVFSATLLSADRP